MSRRSSSVRSAPHSRVKRAALDRAAMSLDEQWVADIRQRIRADYHPFQAAAVNDPSKRISLLWGRGVGKTALLRARALDLMVSTRDAMIPYVATRPLGM